MGEEEMWCKACSRRWQRLSFELCTSTTGDHYIHFRGHDVADFVLIPVVLQSMHHAARWRAWTSVLRSRTTNVGQRRGLAWAVRRVTSMPSTNCRLPTLRRWEQLWWSNLYEKWLWNYFKNITCKRYVYVRMWQWNPHENRVIQPSW